MTELFRALAVLPADRMDRHEIDDVEAHRADLVEPGGAILEGRAARRVAALRARKHLVPGGEARGDPVDGHLELMAVAHRGTAIGQPRHEAPHRRRAEQGRPLVLRGHAVDIGENAAESLGVGAARPPHAAPR